MDAASLIESFLTGTYTVTRRERGTFYNGVVVPGDVTNFEIDAAVTPASGADLQRLPEGRQQIETRIVYTKTKLEIGTVGSPYESDRVAIDGKSWEVQHVEAWQQGDGSYFRCIVQVSDQ